MSPTTSERKRMTLIHDTSEIPEFATEAEERTYWDSHAFSEELLAKVKPEDEPAVDLPPRNGTASKSISLRLDNDSVNRLKILARKKEVPYQTLLKRFVTERLYEEEKRAGLVHAKRETARRETH